MGTVAAFLYALLYVLMEPVAGGLCAPLIITGVAYGNYLTDTYGSKANWIGFYVHVASWIAQFIGHGKFEGRAPALMDNLVQALFLAPLFVWIEVLFSLGYRPELKKRLDKAVEEEIAKFKTQSINGSANGGHKEAAASTSTWPSTGDTKSKQAEWSTQSLKRRAGSN